MARVKALSTHTFGDKSYNPGDVYDAEDQYVETLKAAKFSIPEDQWEQYHREQRGTAEEDAAAGITDGGCGAGMPITEYVESISGVNDPAGQAAAELVQAKPTEESIRSGVAGEPHSAALTSGKGKYSRSDMRAKK